MYQNEVYQLTYQALLLILILSAPPILISMVLGLMVAIFQAATQIQEQTLTFVPKMVVVMIVIGATFPWMSRLVMEMALGLWENIPLYSQ